ncbi:hypothetical protein QAD02_012359 [Eretmocerus hayati]|uniref:Uncharacterized protein n=1 Tax=Eretmocerus hayati TaxID=131215 RepID=A0ACC2P290_9HYME|nr:hypothetical protein QAD02_012359 [Eretmocerus hayati]
MYVLVYWTEYGNTSIILEEDLDPNKVVGEITSAKYLDGSIYEAKIMAKSYDREYLENLTVSADGETMAHKRPRLRTRRFASSKKRRRLNRDRQDDGGAHELENEVEIREENEAERERVRLELEREREQIEAQARRDREVEEEREKIRLIDQERENQRQRAQDEAQRLDAERERQRAREEAQRLEAERERQRAREEEQRLELERNRQRAREEQEREQQRARQVELERQRELARELEEVEQQRLELERELRRAREREEREVQLVQNEDGVPAIVRRRPAAVPAPEQVPPAPELVPDYRHAGAGRVQLCNVYNVWIDAGTLTYFSRYWSNPKELTRKLLRSLLGDAALTNMCARGRATDRNRRRVPEEVKNSVEYYVNKKCSRRLEPVEFTNVTNMMCASLRNPRR